MKGLEEMNCDTWMSFDSVKEVYPNESVAISVTAQIPFVPYMIRAPHHVTRYFTIDDIKLGKNSMTVAAGRAPFESLQAIRLEGWPIVRVAENVTFNVTNISGAQVRFMAVLLGRM